jgi:multicomponent Na+:H+ antiporter subunit D
MSADLLVFLFLLTPVAHAMAVGAASRFGLIRDALNILGALVYAGVAFALLSNAWYGDEGGYVALARPLPSADFAFAPERLGLTVAATIVALGALNAAFTGGYLRALDEPRPARAQVLIALSIGMAGAAALAANLFTFLLCYEALSVASFALVAHRGDTEARRAAQLYLGVLLIAAIALLLPAMVWTEALAGRLDFVAGGLLAGRIEPVEANVLLALFAFGLAASALAPLHVWLPAAVEAPTPAAGIVHAVAVASIGALGLIKIAVFIFGAAMAEALLMRRILLALSLGGACVASLIALSKDELKPRLAYSTIAHIGLSTAGAMLATPVAIFAAMFQLVAHGVAKSSLFFTAGAVEVVTGRTKVSELGGLGRRMPWAFGAFALAALSLAGAPPLAGAWSLLWLIAGAEDANHGWAAALMLVSALIGFATLCPPAAKALFGPAPGYPFVRPDAASALLITPVAIAGGLSLLLLFLVDPLSRFLGVRLSP